MNYIVFDLEFNQSTEPKKENKPESHISCPFEIIQIGAVKLDENLETIETFDKMIKPELYPTLHPFVQNMTGITIEELNVAQPFQEIYDELLAFTNGEENIFCVWGLTDMKELFRNVVHHNLSTAPIPKQYINVQQPASAQLHCPGGTIGLRNAIELFNISVNNQFHNALNDAVYTAEIFKKIYNEQLKPKTYEFNRRPKILQQKQKLDENKLYAQIETMFHKKLAQEDKDLIKLVYLMGKSNQFQVPDRTENPQA